MAENNGKMTKNTLTHLQFLKAVQLLKENRHIFFDKRPSEKDAAPILSKIAGFEISPHSIGDIKTGAGVEWEARIVRHSSPDSIRQNAHRTLASAIVRLYVKLGEELPESLVALHNHLVPNAPVLTDGTRCPDTAEVPVIPPKPLTSFLGGPKK